MSALIYCPFPDRETARTVIAQLLSEKLVACGNIHAETESHFMFEGALEQASEIPVLLKTHATLLEQAVERLSDLHPYEVPAVLGWQCEAVAGKTAAWLSELI